MTITPDELRAIRERADAATDLTDVHNTITSESVARTDVPALCDAYESALAEVERLRRTLEYIASYPYHNGNMFDNAPTMVAKMSEVARQALGNDGGDQSSDT